MGICFLFLILLHWEWIWSFNTSMMLAIDFKLIDCKKNLRASGVDQ